jgi:CAAX prenyl protease N-terminal, five membrane helices
MLLMIARAAGGTQLALGLLLAPPIVAGFTWILLHTGPYVALYLWAFLFGLSILIMTVYPVLIAPLFNKFEPLQEGNLRCGPATPSSPSLQVPWGPSPAGPLGTLFFRPLLFPGVSFLPFLVILWGGPLPALCLSPGGSLFPLPGGPWGVPLPLLAGLLRAAPTPSLMVAMGAPAPLLAGPLGFPSSHSLLVPWGLLFPLSLVSWGVPEGNPPPAFSGWGEVSPPSLVGPLGPCSYRHRRVCVCGRGERE